MEDKGQGSTCSSLQNEGGRPSADHLIILGDNENRSAAFHCAIPLTYCLALVMSRTDAFTLFLHYSTQPARTHPFAKLFVVDTMSMVKILTKCHWFDRLHQCLFIKRTWCQCLFHSSKSCRQPFVKKAELNLYFKPGSMVHDINIIFTLKWQRIKATLNYRTKTVKEKKNDWEGKWTCTDESCHQWMK